MSTPSDGSGGSSSGSGTGKVPTPENFDELRAKLSDHIASMARASEAAQLVRGEAETADRDLRVVIKPDGEIETLEITPSAMQHEPEALAEELKSLLQLARADVSTKVAAIFAAQGPPPVTLGPAGDVDLRKSMDQLGVGDYLRDAERLAGGPLI